MKPATERAYLAWRRAADKGYGNVRVDTPGRMARIDANVRRLKARYETLLAAEKPADDGRYSRPVKIW